MTSKTEFQTDRRAAPRASTDATQQGIAPHTVRYMLAIGLAGVIIAFAIIYFIFV